MVADKSEALAAAKELIKRFGDKAAEEAEARVRELEKEGQKAACEFWVEVLYFVRILSNETPSEPKH